MKRLEVGTVQRPLVEGDDKEELEKARQEAEAEAQKLIDDAQSKKPPKSRKPRSQSLPEHLPEVKKLCDVLEKERVCPEHGAMTQIGVDSTQTLVYEPPKL